MVSPRRIALTPGAPPCGSLSVAYWNGARPIHAAAARSESELRIVRDIAYTNPADPKNARRQTLDLHLPAMSAEKPPLVVFIHGGFWTLSDDDYRIGPAFADALVPNGAAVALVRYRLAPDYQHPAQAEDVAAAI